MTEALAELRRVLPQARRRALESGTSVHEILAAMLGRSPGALNNAPLQLAGAWVLPDPPEGRAAYALRADLLPTRLGRALGCAAVSIDSTMDSAVVLMSDPWDDTLLRRVNRAAGQPLAPALSTPQRIADLIAAGDAESRASGSLDEMPLVSQEESSAHAIDLISIEMATSPVVRFVDAVLFDGWKAAASDIHFEMTRAGVTAQLRLDGVLVEAARFNDRSRSAEVVSRIKVLAALDVAETRVPQDGRFRVRFADRTIDFRVSVMPSAIGEDVVLRLLDKSHLRGSDQSITLDSLGFESSMRDSLLAIASLPHGMLLVTGPTGSGKTTTLYALLAQTRSVGEKIVTIEDPVEYELPGVLQVPVNERKGLSFAKGLRSILRHDPDRILVGEIRDGETAEIAVQAALTGHQVYTTVHANNAFDVIGRFVHLHVDLFGLASSINGVLAQRLVRLNCRACARPIAENDADATLFRQLTGGDSELHLQRGLGCDHCRNTGFSRRTVISELLTFDDELRELVTMRAPLTEMKQAARKRSTQSMRWSALELVRRGITTLSEVQRVVSLAKEG